MIKSEKRKLRQAEINQFKLEQDVDRKFETGKIIKRHQQLEDQLHSKFIIQLIIVLGKRKDMTDYLKLIENERKNKMIKVIKVIENVFQRLSNLKEKFAWL